MAQVLALLFGLSVLIVEVVLFAMYLRQIKGD